MWKRGWKGGWKNGGGDVGSGGDFSAKVEEWVGVGSFFPLIHRKGWGYTQFYPPFWGGFYPRRESETNSRKGRSLPEIHEAYYCYYY
jgi:hypothetical protein